MAALWILAGVIWFIYQLGKDSNTKQVPKDLDFFTGEQRLLFRQIFCERSG